MTEWTPQSWRGHPAAQQPSYPDPERLETVLARLATLPPLVAPGAVMHLQGLLADVAQGRRFLLQGGDCAEQFADCHPQPWDSAADIPVYSRQRLFRNSFGPSGRLHQAITGMGSIT